MSMSTIDLKKTVIGIELGSTRIKAVMINDKYMPVASGSHTWKNRLVNGIWTYSMDDIVNGLQDCFHNLKEDFQEKYGFALETTGAIGISAMMHGYLPFDENWTQLAEFRTWRNTTTGPAAKVLTDLFHFNIPQRWSVAHLYQAVLNNEEHVEKIRHLTTLAGYISWRLSGQNIMGIGEASGMFPIDSEKKNFDDTMLDAFDDLISGKYPWKIRDILPQVVCAGEQSGTLTKEGALFLDPKGTLKPGIPVVPCEGDAGTGMTATNSVRIHTGNVSAGTSDFAMIVTDHTLGVHREIDMVTTPEGQPVAMVHCNNCTSDINAWVNLFKQYSELMGYQVNTDDLYTALFNIALEGDSDAGGIVTCNYYSGEGVTDFNAGMPLLIRKPDAEMTLANFMRAHLLSALSTLKIGLDILTSEENVPIERLYGHGGFFKTPQVGQRLLSAAVNAPVSVMETAGEGGPYGMALLGAYMLWHKQGETLADYLDNNVFKDAKVSTVMADQNDIDGFEKWMKRYKGVLKVERQALKVYEDESCWKN